MKIIGNQLHTRYILVVIFLCTTAGAIFWNTTQITLKIGNDIDTELVCYVPEFDIYLTRTWKRGNGQEQELLTYNGASSYAKFIETTYFFGFGIIIQNLSEEDLNMNYTCTYGFEICSANFTLNEKDFILLPTSENVKKTITYLDRTFTYKVQIKRIFPVPKCFCLIGANNFTSSLDLSQTKIGLFYNVNVSLNFQVNEIELCMNNNITMACYIGTTPINISESVPSYNTACNTPLKGSGDSSAIHFSLVIGPSFFIWVIRKAETVL